MRTVPASIQAALDAGAATLCYCWRITLQNGTVLGFTNHDETITFDGVDYEPRSGFTPSEVEASLGLAVDTEEVEGVLDSARIREQDLRAGLWDNADIVVWLVDWSSPASRMILRTASTGQVLNGNLGFTAEMRGLTHRLNQSGGRFYKTTCDAEIGDARCGIDLSDDRYRATGTVASSDGSLYVYPVNLETVAGNTSEGLFAGGKITFTSGANAGLTFGVRQHIGSATKAALVLDGPTPADIAPGDAFTAVVGCDKAFDTCNRFFGNRLNFRGFNLIPGNDRALRPVDPEDEYANDGGSLFGQPLPPAEAVDEDNSSDGFFDQLGILPDPLGLFS